MVAARREAVRWLCPHMMMPLGGCAANRSSLGIPFNVQLHYESLNFDRPARGSFDNFLDIFTWRFGEVTTLVSMDSSDDTHTVTISLFAGNVINLYLYGALTVQLYLYYTFFPKDSRIFKSVIYAVFVIETIHTVLLIYDLGLLLFHHINFPRISHMVVPVCGGMAAFLTQAVYAYRIQIITKRKHLSWFIATVIVLQFIAIIVLRALGVGIFDILIIVWVLISLVVDIIVAGTMVFYLKRDKIHSKLLRWKITRVVYIVIGTGALTVAINAFTVLSYLISPYVPSGPIIVLSKLYSNSMMVLVNDRLSSSEESRHASSHLTTTEISGFHLDTEITDAVREDLAAGRPKSYASGTAVEPLAERCDQLETGA